MAFRPVYCGIIIGAVRPVAFSVLLALAPAFAQTAPEFEAASVKWVRRPPTIDPMDPANSLGALPVMKGGPGTATPTRIRYSNVTLNALLMKAYDLHGDQIDGPAWLKDNKYIIEAVVPEGAAKAQFLVMLQNLLVQRFRIEFDWQEKDFKVYRLTVAPGGHKLKRSAVDHDEDLWDNPLYSTVAAQQAGTDAQGCLVLPPGHRASAGKNTCTSYVGWSMLEFAIDLGRMVAAETGARASWAHVIDETGLTGWFDFNLHYDQGYYMFSNIPNLPPNVREGITNHGVSIFKSLEPQLSLKLDPTTAKLKVMAIRSVDRIPTED